MKKGAFTLRITPFRKDYSLDEQALRNLVRRQAGSEIDGIAPLGVTGEESTGTYGAHRRDFASSNDPIK